MPGAGRVAAVIETRQRDGFDQRIAYEGGDGRNHAEIALRTETGDLLLAFPPRLAKPSEFGIAGEIAVRFPGEAMRVVAPRRNAYGPVGMALGVDCLYAWQWFERPRPGAQGQSRDGLLGLADPSALRRALSLRIRLCRTAQASLDQLVAAVERLTIALPADGIARPVPAPRPPPRRRPPRPAPEARKAPPPDRTSPERPPQERPAPDRTSPERPPQAEPAPTRPTVPVPPAEGGRRYLAPRAPDSRAPDTRPAEPPPAPEAAPRGGSQRYITDGPQPAEPPGATPTPSPAPNAVPGRGTGETLSRDLPPEAYRPPPERGPGR
ncbi:cellulose biosynthesis protein BcsN [Methylobacterium sp. DB0501]|nr:cellulose biosynthesis protein BcsN [Methylobacterium sp. DB0501]